MPKSCRECDFIDLDEDIDRGYFYSCAVTGKCVSQMYNCRDEDCPMVEIPTKHGRLIDADRMDLQSELFTFTRYTGIDEAPLEDATSIIDKAPTVVPAEKGGAE